MQDINVQLSEMDEGSLQERFDHELSKVIENVMDPNTDRKKKRQVTITIDVTTNERREEIYLESSVKSKLVSREAVQAKALIGKSKTGKVMANELKSGVAGQMFFDANDSRLKDDIGTPVEEIEAQQAQKQSGVVDFREKAQGK